MKKLSFLFILNLNKLFLQKNVNRENKLTINVVEFSCNYFLFCYPLTIIIVFLVFRVDDAVFVKC